MPIDRRLFLQLAAAAATAPVARASGLEEFHAILQPSLIRSENDRPGTRDWEITRPAVDRRIEAYAGRTSVNRGQSISIHVSTSDARWTADVFRLGWYGGDGARMVVGGLEGAGGRQPDPSIEAQTGLIECQWNPSLTIDVGADDDWPSGVYLVRLTGQPSGEQVQIPFTVRDDSRNAAFLFQNSVTTWQAYNSWGGKSLYVGDPQARIVSFDRPYDRNGGAGELFRWEINMLRFLEREGYDVAYCTNVDLHRDGSLLDRARAILSVGHDEYWSWEMRANVERAISRGAGIGFFSGNNCYWQIRFAPNASGAADRRIVAYKEAALQQDPLALDGNPSNDHLVTSKWRDAPVSRPEDALIGVMYQSGNYGIDADIVVENTSHWVYQGTGLRVGDHLPGLLGYEVDEIAGHAPATLVRLAHSPFSKANDSTGFSDMTVYEAPSRAAVFATGSIQWAWGLDDYAPSTGARVNIAAQQITRNVLARLASRPGPRRRIARR